MGKFFTALMSFIMIVDIMFVVSIHSIFNVIANEKYQRKAAKNGLAVTVVEMSKEENMTASEIARRLGIKEKDVYDIFETEEAVR